ncbi:hypothetical protein Nocox_16675 [Nonomuraea coxensis DSM 45129]|uniref:Uncharacterized protein n=1 Tax=Nonomuraea coxensis DSM 45129 TaxID=1122611 RepID=A0ABX8U2S7_9ACTN|nr:hypothetical protein [Nonomuraea coxensis]QYC40948.1 hypothetical protein Nocox_16675 [Nonomuraea coxensis DSM 45129]
MKSVRRMLQMVAAGGALAAGMTVLPATAAHAANNCDAIYTTFTYEVFCYSSNYDEFRAQVRCYRIGRDSYTTRYGDWTRVGTKRSVAKCTTSEEPASGSYTFRNV